MYYVCSIIITTICTTTNNLKQASIERYTKRKRQKHRKKGRHNFRYIQNLRDRKQETET